ncbi:hypothetical protein BGZ61DRAFT_593942 [Ilyonectria robusta]|uniref:uncharacterized protein n=1 Tax=Ilyonectria robusta TaxID=1079257 RepID=UPI001E8E288B|nr:uncharacterized protein BGZ61DRAFT_593942 [Ilyonectria robusta]KAH8659532.1 hypothetical protein BGZ61DRAFT_593942 [Ilyonectria robusta]
MGTPSSNNPSSLGSNDSGFATGSAGPARQPSPSAATGTSEPLPTSSKSASTPDEIKFRRLLSRYQRYRINGAGSTAVAMDMLWKELANFEEAKAFFEWTNVYFKTTTYFNFDEFAAMSNVDFRTQLATANWISGGEALSLVNSRLSCNDLKRGANYIPLGRYQRFLLSLHADSMVMIPREADAASLDAHDLTAVNSNNILGAQYDSARGSEKQTLLFAQLGRIMSTRINDGHLDASLAGRHWDDTGFVLALEILESGSAGNFYMICNLTRQDDVEELSDEDIASDPGLLKLCGEETSFTVAQVDGQGPELLKDTWENACDERAKIRLTVLSTSRPEIVETGFVRLNDGDGRGLVALI